MTCTIDNNDDPIDEPIILINVMKEKFHTTY